MVQGGGKSAFLPHLSLFNAMMAPLVCGTLILSYIDESTVVQIEGRVVFNIWLKDQKLPNILQQHTYANKSGANAELIHCLVNNLLVQSPTVKDKTKVTHYLLL